MMKKRVIPPPSQTPLREDHLGKYIFTTILRYLKQVHIPSLAKRNNLKNVAVDLELQESLHEEILKYLESDVATNFSFEPTSEFKVEEVCYILIRLCVPTLRV